MQSILFSSLAIFLLVVPVCGSALAATDVEVPIVCSALIGEQGVKNSAVRVGLPQKQEEETCSDSTDSVPNPKYLTATISYKEVQPALQFFRAVRKDGMS